VHLHIAEHLVLSAGGTWRLASGVVFSATAAKGLRQHELTLLRLPWHLGKAAVWTDCVQLLCDLRFLRARVDHRLTELHVEDVQRAIGLLRRHAALEEHDANAARDFTALAETLAEMEAFLIAEKGVLAQLPELVAQQAANQPRGTAPALIAAAELTFEARGKVRAGKRLSLLAERRGEEAKTARAGLARYSAALGLESVDPDVRLVSPGGRTVSSAGAVFDVSPYVSPRKRTATAGTGSDGRDAATAGSGGAGGLDAAGGSGVGEEGGLAVLLRVGSDNSRKSGGEVFPAPGPARGILRPAPRVASGALTTAHSAVCARVVCALPKHRTLAGPRTPGICGLGRERGRRGHHGAARAACRADLAARVGRQRGRGLCALAKQRCGARGRRCLPAAPPPRRPPPRRPPPRRPPAALARNACAACGGVSSGARGGQAGRGACSRRWLRRGWRS
jgi:hypothetical protein